MKQLKYQQGDVLLFSIDQLPTEVTRKMDNIVARGETTGHYHEIQGANVFEHAGLLFVDAPDGATIIHQEHDEIEIEPGVYEVGIVREYDHFFEEARSVRD